METLPTDVNPGPGCPGAWLPSGVWKDEQLVRQELVREGKITADRKGGPGNTEP